MAESTAAVTVVRDASERACRTAPKDRVIDGRRRGYQVNWTSLSARTARKPDGARGGNEPGSGSVQHVSRGLLAPRAPRLARTALTRALRAGQIAASPEPCIASPTADPPDAPAAPGRRTPWAWVPSLYFAEGLPYVVALIVSVILYKRLGVGNAQIALYTSWLYLPWVIKPLWSPIVDVLRTKRGWVVAMQLLIAVACAGVALAIQRPGFLFATLAIFWLMAFASATHDIAADGFYMLGLAERQQSAFIGFRSTFYRLGMVAGQGALVVVAGVVEKRTGDTRLAWSATFVVLAAVFVALAGWHRHYLPRPASDVDAHAESVRQVLKRTLEVFALFFQKKDIGRTLLFLLFYRFAEAQLSKLISPFLLDARIKGGLGLTTSQVGIAYGTVGLLALATGGLLGGLAIASGGLKRWMWIMVFAIHLPDLAFVFLSQVQPSSFLLINCAIAVEQFGYGFGFTAYGLYMIMVADGPYKTAHYAICTGLMALGQAIPGMFSGWIQERLGYPHFFLWVILATLPGFAVAALVRVDPEFGKKAA